MNEVHLYAAIRYVERNPVRAKIVDKAWEYRWSSAKAHINKKKDRIIDNSFVAEEIKDWASYISEEDDQNDLIRFRRHSNTGRPLGGKKFIEVLEKTSGRNLQIKKLGPKKQKDK